MILQGILKYYATDPAMVKRAKPGTGNPTGSAFGKCSYQLQALRYPALSKPTGTRPRGLMVFENGDLLEKWWSEKIEQAHPGMSGFQQEPFYFPVAVTPGQAVELARRMGYRYGVPGGIWGRRVDGFRPPWIRAEDGALAFQLMADGAKKIGFVLDAPALTLWCPTYIDRAMIDNDGKLVAIEKKAVSSFAFKRMLVGMVDYQKQCQLAGIAEALHCDVAMLAVRKDTMHLLELYYSRDGVEQTTVKILRSNGMAEQFLVDNGQLMGEDGAPSKLDDKEWDAGEVRSPYAPAVLEEIRARILRVLLAEDKPETWHREYGPSFQCKQCRGTGTQSTRKGSKILLLKPKPCTGCAESGQMPEAELPEFPCGYCPVVLTCWEKAEVKLDITKKKPRYTVQRAAYETAGLVFYSPTMLPEIPEPEEEPVVDDE